MKELMNPRIVVTGHYPKSPFKIGDILELAAEKNGWYWKFDEELQWYVNGVSPDDVEKSTTIFRKMHYSEMLTIDQLPQYVKAELTDHIFGGNFSGVYKVDKWEMASWGYWFVGMKGDEGVIIPIKATSVATEQEYTDYITSKTTTSK